MLSLDEYRILDTKAKLEELERLETLIEFTERSVKENDTLELQLEKLYHFYNLGQAYLWKMQLLLY